MPVDMRAKPYYLDDEAVQWVEDTIASMSLEEKIGQLFFLHFYCPRNREGHNDDSSYSSLRWFGGVVTSFYQGSVWTSFCSPKVLHLIV